MLQSAILFSKYAGSVFLPQVIPKFKSEQIVFLTKVMNLQPGKLISACIYRCWQIGKIGSFRNVKKIGFLHFHNNWFLFLWRGYNLFVLINGVYRIFLFLCFFHISKISVIWQKKKRPYTGNRWTIVLIFGHSCSTRSHKEQIMKFLFCPPQVSIHAISVVASESWRTSSLTNSYKQLAISRAPRDAITSGHRYMLACFFCVSCISNIYWRVFNDKTPC